MEQQTSNTLRSIRKKDINLKTQTLCPDACPQDSAIYHGAVPPVLRYCFLSIGATGLASLRCLGGILPIGMVTYPIGYI